MKTKSNNLFDAGGSPTPHSEAGEEVAAERRLFAANFRKARRAAHLSQRDVQAQTGLTQAYISEVERCLSNPSLQSMAKMARVVGQPLYLLLTPEPSEQRDQAAPQREKAPVPSQELGGGITLT